jgi:hypothetical protein
MRTLVVQKAKTNWGLVTYPANRKPAVCRKSVAKLFLGSCDCKRNCNRLSFNLPRNSVYRHRNLLWEQIIFALFPDFHTPGPTLLASLHQIEAHF